MFVERLHIGEDAFPIWPITHEQHVVDFKQRRHALLPASISGDKKGDEDKLGDAEGQIEIEASVARIEAAKVEGGWGKAMNEGAEGHAISPRRREVRDGHLEMNNDNDNHV